ncbi:hypothetical protein LOD99_16164 [Oopsacas minuta]|uniref:Uncharacterized protein n=1 Tax=Oopsacas minuta TaxID=111878 RepID=A0AAV7K9A2_9METZ|nr:hypothetical protein LOD99_16164 [Oopsacas minuta]
MSSRVYDVHEPKPDCDPGMTYLADKSKIEEPYSKFLSILWAVLLISVFFYSLRLHLKHRRRKLGLSLLTAYKVITVGSVKFTEGESKRRLFLLGLEQGSSWSKACVTSIIEKLSLESFKCEIVVVGRSIPPPDEYHQNVTRYVSADLTEATHLQKLFPEGETGWEDTLVYFATPSHMKDWINSDLEKRISWDAPVNTITHSVRDESTIGRIILVSSAFVLCENTISRKPALKSTQDAHNPISSVNDYFLYLRSVENLLLNKASKKLDTFILRTYETQELISNSPYGHYLRQMTSLRQQRCFVTQPSLLAARITQLVTGHYTTDRKVTNVGEEMDANDFLMDCTPMIPCNLIYFMHTGLHRPLIQFNKFCYDFLGRCPFGVHFNYSTYALFNKYILLPATTTT